jgi:hypothetical protein
MSSHENLTLILPTEAASKLKAAAEQENDTVATYVSNVLEGWLEKRRRDVRLGRTRRLEALPQSVKGANIGGKG